MNVLLVDDAPDNQTVIGMFLGLAGAHALKEERDRCIKVGCTDHFTKPIDRAKLISLVDQVVHRPH